MPRFALRFPHMLLILTLLPIALAFGQNSAVAPQGTATRTPASRFEGAVAGLKEAEQALYLFERVERIEYRKSASDAQPYEVKVSRVFPAGTGIAHIALGPDGNPANAAAYRAELEKLLSSLTWAAASGKPQREAYEKVAKRQKERFELIDSTRSAFVFTFLSQETRGERMLSKFKMEPNPKYKSITRATSIFARVKGFVWIDDASGQLARVEGEVTDDISFGLFVAKIYKGSHFMQERYEFAPGIWLPSFSQYDFDGRKFFSPISIHEKTFASKYRRVGPPVEAIPIIREELEKFGSSAKSQTPANYCAERVVQGCAFMSRSSGFCQFNSGCAERCCAARKSLPQA